MLRSIPKSSAWQPATPILARLHILVEELLSFPLASGRDFSHAASIAKENGLQAQRNDLLSLEFNRRKARGAPSLLRVNREMGGKRRP